MQLNGTDMRDRRFQWRDERILIDNVSFFRFNKAFEEPHGIGPLKKLKVAYLKLFYL